MSPNPNPNPRTMPTVTSSLYFSPCNVVAESGAKCSVHVHHWHFQIQVFRDSIQNVFSSFNELIVLQIFEKQLSILELYLYVSVLSRATIKCLINDGSLSEGITNFNFS